MRCILFVIVIVFASNAFAQEKCESVISLSKVVRDIVLDQESVEQHARSFCSEYRQYKTSGKSMDIGASYKFLAATFASSNVSAEDIASKYCSASQDYSASKSTYKQYVESIAPGAYEAYTKCQEFRSRNVAIDVQSIRDPKILQVTVNFTQNTRKDAYAEVKYSDELPPGVTCHWDESKSNVQKVEVGTHLLTCKRTDPMAASHIVIFRRDAASPDSVLTLYWPAYNAQGHPVDSLKALQDKVSALESRLSTISQSGTIQMKAVNTPGLEEVGHGGKERGELNGYEKFPVAFSTTPTVSAGLSQLVITSLDVRDRRRVHFEITEVNKEGFKYKFWTAGDVKVSLAIISWIAVTK